MVIFSSQDENREERSWSAQHLISADTGHTDSLVITISVVLAALHADEPDNQRFLALETQTNFFFPRLFLKLIKFF